jgi:hydroxypyruvate isomerase
MPLVLMNVPQGDVEAGERGLAALPRREAEVDA